MIWVLLQSESPWQRNNAITFFIYFCVSLYRRETIMADTNSLKRFLKKKLLVQRNTKTNKKRNGVVTLLWRLRLQ